MEKWNHIDAEMHVHTVQERYLIWHGHEDSGKKLAEGSDIPLHFRSSLWSFFVLSMKYYENLFFFSFFFPNRKCANKLTKPS